MGMGYFGVVAATGFAKAGHDVVGVDVDDSRLQTLRAGRLHFYEPGLVERVQAAVGSGRLRFAHLREAPPGLGDAAVVAVGTPPLESGGISLTQVQAAVDWICGRSGGGELVVMKSTVPPGFGNSLQAILRAKGLRYAAVPGFLREGQAVGDWDEPDRIVVGVAPGDEASAALVQSMHGGMDYVSWMVTDVTSAEMIKYASNAFLATRISFINEIAHLCGFVGASIDAVSEGLAGDRRLGGRLLAGVGYDGSCLPKDTRALNVLSYEGGGSGSALLQAVMSVNDRQRQQPLHALWRRFGRDLSGLSVGLLGLAFKPGTDDTRDAVSLGLARELVLEGVSVCAWDPRVRDFRARGYPVALREAESFADAVSGRQALILLAPWPEIVERDWRRAAALMAPPRFVFDGRNALDAGLLRASGIEYVGVGRPAGEMSEYAESLPQENAAGVS